MSKNKKQLKHIKANGHVDMVNEENGTVLRRETLFAGPIPSPDVLEHYNKIEPGLAGRIVSMAEVQSAHRQSLEQKVISGDNLRANAGLVFGLLIALTGLGLSTFAAVKGQPWFGAAIGGATLCSMVATFVVGARKKEQALSKDSEAE